MRRYTVSGQVFFASADTFMSAFDYKELKDKVCIDVGQADFGTSPPSVHWTRSPSNCGARALPWR